MRQKLFFHSEDILGIDEQILYCIGPDSSIVRVGCVRDKPSIAQAADYLLIDFGFS